MNLSLQFGKASCLAWFRQAAVDEEIMLNKSSILSEIYGIPSATCGKLRRYTRVDIEAWKATAHSGNVPGKNGTLEKWNHGYMETWKNGKLEKWKPGIWLWPV